MSIFSMKKDTQTVDLTNYADNILSEEDLPLFDEAIKAGKTGALRAAYLMIWLACAESLKRRFREAQKRDDTAGKIVGQIETKESEHKAVDKFLLKEAYNYGFLSDSDHTGLNHVYNMRCIYGHPYEEAPSQEQVSHAAQVVVASVLSKPVTLRHGFGKTLLKNLLEEPSFLDDQQTVVKAFAKDILPRLDESIHGWLLDNYLKELEKIAGDSSMSVFFRRGMWFSGKVLMIVGVDVFTHDDWHERTIKFPKILMHVCSSADIFGEIGERAQDSLVGFILVESGSHASILRHLERLNNNGALTIRQKERFVEHVSKLDIASIHSSCLSTQTCYGRLIDAMKSSNWYAQNPAVDLIISNGPDQTAILDEERQVNLGRNILQCAQGGARSASRFLEELSKDGLSWPFNVVRGITLESFTNESNEIRFKIIHLDRVITALGQLKNEQQVQLISEIVASVNEGSLKSWVDQDDFETAIQLLNNYPWAKPLIAGLKEKAAGLSVHA